MSNWLASNILLTSSSYKAFFSSLVLRRLVVALSMSTAFPFLTLKTILASIITCFTSQPFYFLVMTLSTTYFLKSSVQCVLITAEIQSRGNNGPITRMRYTRHLQSRRSGKYLSKPAVFSTILRKSAVCIMLEKRALTRSCS